MNGQSFSEDGQVLVEPSPFVLEQAVRGDQEEWHEEQEDEADQQSHAGTGHEQGVEQVAEDQHSVEQAAPLIGVSIDQALDLQLVAVVQLREVQHQVLHENRVRHWLLRLALDLLLQFGQRVGDLKNKSLREHHFLLVEQPNPALLQLQLSNLYRLQGDPVLFPVARFFSGFGN